MVITEDATVLAHNPVTAVDTDAAAIAAGMVAGLRYITSQYGLGQVTRIDTELQQGGSRRRLIVRPLASGHILLVITSQNPNLGLIDLLLQQVR